MEEIKEIVEQFLDENPIVEYRENLKKLKLEKDELKDRIDFVRSIHNILENKIGKCIQDSVEYKSLFNNANYVCKFLQDLRNQESDLSRAYLQKLHYIDCVETFNKSKHKI